MSNPANPFLNVDFSKLMDPSKLFDFSKMVDVSKLPDFGAAMGNYKLPNIDVDSMMASQRKSLEAIAGNNQKAFETLQSYMRRQTDLARQSFEATASLMQAIMSAPTAEEKVAKQVEATKSAIESCVSSLKELSDILSQNNMQAMQTVSDAVCESMNNIQSMIKK